MVSSGAAAADTAAADAAAADDDDDDDDDDDNQIYSYDRENNDYSKIQNPHKLDFFLPKII